MAEIHDKYPFTKRNVEVAPAEHGVYILYDRDEIIYIGRAVGDGVSIRSRLQRHHSGSEGKCTQSATHYSREPNSRPVSREKELLDWFVGRYGRLPRCNDRRA